MKKECIFCYCHKCNNIPTVCGSGVKPNWVVYFFIDHISWLFIYLRVNKSTKSINESNHYRYCDVGLVAGNSPVNFYTSQSFHGYNIYTV